MKVLFYLWLCPLIVFSQNPSTKLANEVTITRDNWGIPHIEAKTDAAAVFGLIYAQCEDDFNRIELNYIEKLGRLSEINGEKDLYNDLLIRLLIDESKAKEDYLKAEPWLKKLLDAHANGINYFLAKNPKIKPKLITKFEPWYPLLWTDGSIGAISTADITSEDLGSFYGHEKIKVGLNKSIENYQQTGSNGLAIAPKLTKDGHAMLYINPHTSFYFRPEVHIKSNEGLNAYGAVTWGQFFIYQGFNEYCGWMHTSSIADVADTFNEKVVNQNGVWYYKYDGKLIKMGIRNIKIDYLSEGQKKSKNFETYFTKNGPVMTKRGDNWVSLSSYNRSMKSLVQSWLRTKAKGFEDYKKIMDLKANTSNNTVFADKFGNIAYWHGNFMPKRNKSLNWSKAQDGSVSSNSWHGLHTVNEVVHSYNPANGWLQNCNSTPYTVSDTCSPHKNEYPKYMAPDGENFRGLNASRLLKSSKDLSLDDLIKLGYDNYLMAFQFLIPEFLNKTKDQSDADILKVRDILSKWDYRCTESSVATTLAIEWAQLLSPKIKKVYIEEGEDDQVTATQKYMANATVQELINPMKQVLATLSKNFGTFEVAWGQLNRFQRINGNIPSEFDDAAESLPMRNASALWGCLPAFNSKYYQNSKKRYGFNGNSFVCAVQFGDKVVAKSLLAGGESGNVHSPHFNDQAKQFTQGIFKTVNFYKEDIEKNKEEQYKPGERKN